MVYMLSDLHIGAKNNNSFFFENTIERYFNEYFFPLCMNNGGCRKDDILVVLGDVFDNRQSVNSVMMSYAIGLFEKLADTFSKVYVICGNHDTPSTKQNCDTSLNCLKHIAGVELVVDKPICVAYEGEILGMLPWATDTEVLKRWAEEMPRAQYLFCHVETAGCLMTGGKGVRSESPFEVDSLGNRNHIFSGHIHIRQEHAKITYVGSPYHLDRNDTGNTKGVYVLDVMQGGSTFYPNNVTPEYKNINIRTIMDSPEEAHAEMRGNYCTVQVPSSLAGESAVKDLVTRLSEGTLGDDGPLTLTTDMQTEGESLATDLQVLESVNDGTFSLADFIKRFIEESPDYDNMEKKALLKLIYEPAKDFENAKSV